MTGALRWATCIIPPLAVIVVEETPGLSGLNGINAAALIVLSPLVIAAGFSITAIFFLLMRWLHRRFRLRSALGFSLLSLTLIGILSLLLAEGIDALSGAIVAASIPAAFLLAPKVIDSAVFQFKPRWKEQLVVTGAGGSFVLDLPMGVLSAYMPTEDVWPTVAPPWAIDLWPQLRAELEAWCSKNNARFYVDPTASVYAT